jgi:hypothetical protein
MIICIRRRKKEEGRRKKEEGRRPFNYAQEPGISKNVYTA